MCGRYRLSRRKQVVEEYFDTAPVEHDWNPLYHIAPTRSVPIIRQNPKEPVREMSLVLWGLIPSWAKDSSVVVNMINARSETASMKPAFRDALKCQRCLIPADAFYEWKRMGKSKQPLLFRSQRRRVVRFRRDLGSLVERQWQRGGNLLDSDHNAKRRDRSCQRPYASHPRSRFVRSVARSGDEGCGFRFRIVESLPR